MKGRNLTRSRFSSPCVSEYHCFMRAISASLNVLLAQSCSVVCSLLWCPASLISLLPSGEQIAHRVGGLFHVDGVHHHLSQARFDGLHNVYQILLGATSSPP